MSSTVVCKEDLKLFHTSLLGNEEDPKGLLNIKQEFLSHYLLQLIVARMWQVVSLEKRRSGNEWLSAMLIPLYKQTHLAPVSYKDSGLKVYLLFKFGQDCLVGVCISLFLYFRIYCMNVSHAIPDDIKHFQQAEPEHYFDYTNWQLEICIWRLKFSI